MTKKISERIGSAQFYILCFLILFGLTAFLFPLNDDWSYLASPQVPFRASALLPTKVFWRPLDALVGMLNGLAPQLYPYSNHLLVVLAHVLSVSALGRIMDSFGIQKKTANLCLLFAMFSPTTCATILSPDALNQAFSLLFGLLGLERCRKNRGRNDYILFCALSVLWKESGIVWIVLIPFLDIMLSIPRFDALYKDAETRKRCLRAILCAALFVVAYFSLRFALQGSFQLGAASGKYALSLFSASAVRNFFHIFACALTGVDTLSYFLADDHRLRFAVTAVLSVVFLLCLTAAAAGMIRKRRNVPRLLSLAAAMLIVSLPHIVMGAAGEMHVYPTLFLTALTLAYCFDSAELPEKLLKAGILCLCAAFCISYAHKLTAIYEYSASAKRLTEQMYEQYDPSGSLLVISVDEKAGYSVFSQSAIMGTSYGNSLKRYFGWRDLNIRKKKVSGADALAQCISKNKDSYDAIWVVENDVISVVR